MSFRNILILLFMLSSLSAWAKEQTYYEILGVSPTATPAEIRKASQRKVMKSAPDRLAGKLGREPTEEELRQANEKLAEIINARKILMDPIERQKYDQFGHEIFTSTEKNQTRDFYSEDLKDIFNKSNKVSQKPISEKSLFLFKRLVLLDGSQAKTELGFTMRDSLLKSLLAEFDISGFSSAGLNQKGADKKLRERILQNMASYTQQVKSIMAENKTTFIKDERFKKLLRDFITEVENRYTVEQITTQERKAVELFYRFSFFNQKLDQFLANQERKLELLKLEKENKLTDADKRDFDDLRKEEMKDLRVFRKMLSALGLPGSTHHDLLLKSYLDALKNSLFQERYANKLVLTHKSRLAHQNFYMEDKEIIKTLRKVKTSFDTIHYENLQSMANPFKLKFLKSFPAQFVVFQAAIGASLYRQSLTDPQFYGANRNPEMLSETMNHLLTPSGVLSFFIFVAVAQQTGYRIYGGGRWLDGKSFKSPLGKVALNGKGFRTIAPGVGLGLGFFVSAVFDELIRDPHLKQCIKTMYKGKPEESASQNYSSACESFYNNWSQGEKWKHYGVDIMTLIGSGVLSHKLSNVLLSIIRFTSTGSNLLIGMTKKIGLRAVGFAGFFIHMYFFMEIHKQLDKYVGQPLKEQISAGGAKNSLVELNERLNQDISQLPSFKQLFEEQLDEDNSGKKTLQDFFKDSLQNIKGGMKTLGVRFKSWAETASMFYMQSAQLWRKQTDKLLRPYEASINLLKDLFIFSKLNYNSDISSESQEGDSYQTISDENERLRLMDLNRRSWFNIEKFLSQDSNQIKEKYCSQVDESLLLWNYFCNSDDNFLELKNLDDDYNINFFFETAQLVDQHLQTISLNKEFELNPIDYVSLKNNELFSSDPKYSIKEINYRPAGYYAFLKAENLMSHDKKFELSRMLIKKGLDLENSFSDLSFRQISQLRSNYCLVFFPDYQKNLESRELYQDCYNSLPEDELKLKLAWSIKLLSAGVYLLKDLVTDLERSNAYYDSQKIEINIGSFSPILSLLKPMEVYKKGEKNFIQTKKMFIQQKNQLNSKEEKDYFTEQFELSNPYTLLKNMICGFDQEEEFLFSSKKFFTHDSLLIYYNSQYQAIDEVCKYLQDRNSFIVHSFLFDIPAELEGQKYENLYLALEEILKNYSSSQELELSFKELSQDQMNRISSKISQDLDLLTENYYKEVIALESPVHANSSLEEFSNYYGKQRIYDIRSFTGGLKGLEISIFQVHYWLETLKKLLLAGEINKLNNAFDVEGVDPDTYDPILKEKFSFNQRKFELMQREILSLLQSYNDTFKKNQSSYFAFPDKEIINQIKIYSGIENRLSLLDLLKQAYPNTESPLMLSSDIILSHIYAHSIPTQYSYSKIQNMIEKEQTLNPDKARAISEQVQNAESGKVRPKRYVQLSWEDLIDSVLIELNRSLLNFFNQLTPLQSKEHFENQVFELQDTQSKEYFDNQVFELQ